MPISTNAPFNEFGQSMILRDIEQLYLALNGAGAGSPGDGQTQDQTAANSGETSPISGGGTTTVANDEGLSLIAVTACVSGVEKTIYVLGYVP